MDVDGDCALAIVPCQYADMGCKHKVRIKVNDATRLYS